MHDGAAIFPFHSAQMDLVPRTLVGSGLNTQYIPLPLVEALADRWLVCHPALKSLENPADWRVVCLAPRFFELSQAEPTHPAQAPARPKCSCCAAATPSCGSTAQVSDLLTIET